MQQTTGTVALAVALVCGSFQVPQEPETHTQTTACFLEEYNFLDAQRENGSWDATDVPDGLVGVHPGLAVDDLWVTSAITLSVLSTGDTSEEGFYRDKVIKSLGWIVSLQEQDGRIVSPGSDVDLLVHALATLAISENRVLSKGTPADSSASTALAYLESRALESGGWSRDGAAVGVLDPRTTAWACMAVASGRDGGIQGEVNRLADAVAALIAYNVMSNEPSTMDLACELLVRFLAEEETSSESYQAASRRLLERPIAADPKQSGYNPEQMYIRTVVAYQSGGKAWLTWRRSIKRTILAGLGAKNRDHLICDPSLTHGGSLAACAFTVLNLQVYFRYATVLGSR